MKNNKYYIFIENKFKDKTFNHLHKYINKDVDFLNYVVSETSFLDKNLDYTPTIGQRLFHIHNNINTIPICQQCEKYAKFYRTNKGYLKSCSKKCGDGSVRMSRIKETLLKEHGDENWNNREKFVQTNIEKYGTEHWMKLDEFKEKVFNTKEERYGDGYFVNKEKGKLTT